MQSSVRPRGAYQTLLVSVVAGLALSLGASLESAHAGDLASARSVPVTQPAARTVVAAAPRSLTAIQLAARYGLSYEDAGTYVMLEGRRLRVRMYPGTRMAVVAGQEFTLKDHIRRSGREVVLSRRIVGFLSHRIDGFFRQERVRQAARAARPVPRPLPALPRRTVVTRVPKTQPAGSAPKSPAPARQVSVGAEPGWIPGPAARHWKWIVIHHSDDEEGSLAKYDDFHRYTRGWEHGCGYHFVIGNGTETGDGQIEVGPRWARQLHGAHAKTPDNRFNDHGIGICLVGDFDRGRREPTEAQMTALVRLTRWLMARYDLDAADVRGHCDCCPTCCPGRHFPWDEYRRRLD